MVANDVQAGNFPRLCRAPDLDGSRDSCLVAVSREMACAPSACGGFRTSALLKFVTTFWNVPQSAKLICARPTRLYFDCEVVVAEMGIAMVEKIRPLGSEIW